MAPLLSILGNRHADCHWAGPSPSGTQRQRVKFQVNAAQARHPDLGHPSDKRRPVLSNNHLAGKCLSDLLHVQKAGLENFYKLKTIT